MWVTWAPSSRWSASPRGPGTCLLSRATLPPERVRRHGLTPPPRALTSSSSLAPRSRVGAPRGSALGALHTPSLDALRAQHAHPRSRAQPVHAGDSDGCFPRRRIPLGLRASTSRLPASHSTSPHERGLSPRQEIQKAPLILPLLLFSKFRWPTGSSQLHHHLERVISWILFPGPASGHAVPRVKSCSQVSMACFESPSPVPTACCLPGNTPGDSGPGPQTPTAAPKPQHVSSFRW